MRSVVAGALVLVLVLVLADTVASGGAAPRDAGVLLVAVSDGSRERLTALDGAATWSRDAERLFVSTEPDNALRYRFAVFAGERREGERIIRSPEVLGAEVTVSPRERRIAFVQAPRDAAQVTGDLTVARLGGASRRLIARAVGTPAGSPDGTHIAVERLSRREATGVPGKRDEPSRIAIVRADGTGRARSAGRGASPTWLPDGRLLLLVDARRSADLVLTRPDGGGRRAVLRDVRGGDWAVSPDGAQLAVAAAGQGSPHYHVTLVDLATGAARRISDERADDVAWSPGGDRLAVTVGSRIVLLDPSGQAAPRTLVRVPRRDFTRPAWSPDGARIAVTAAVVRPYRD
jgi:TolB protein